MALGRPSQQAPAAPGKAKWAIFGTTLTHFTTRNPFELQQTLQTPQWVSDGFLSDKLCKIPTIFDLPTARQLISGVARARDFRMFLLFESTTKPFWNTELHAKLPFSCTQSLSHASSCIHTLWGPANHKKQPKLGQSPGPKNL